MATIGYARYSTFDQNAEAQHRDLETAGCTQIFTDQGISGAKADRPELARLLAYLRPGDHLMVWKLDRLGRDTKHLLELLDQLQTKGITFTSLHDGITTRAGGSAMEKAMATAMLTILSAFATLERDQLIERTKAGLRSARENGRLGGRPPRSVNDPEVRKAKELHNKGLSVEDIGRHLARDIRRSDGTVERNVPLARSTVYRYLAM